MRGNRTFAEDCALRAAVGVGLLAVAGAAQAQSINDWSLQPSQPGSSSPTPAGPVDAQNPVVSPATLAAPDAATTRAPTINAAPPPPDRSPVRNGVPTQTQPKADSPAASHSPLGNEQALAPTPSAAPETATGATPTAEPSAATVAPEPAQPIQPERASSTDRFPLWWIIPIAIAGLLVLGLLYARRRRAGAQAENDVPESPTEEILAEPAAPRPPAPARPTPVFGTEPESPASAPPPGRARGQIDFQPIALRLSLVYATLQFRLLLTAQTEIPEGKLLGDMISAHGSLPQAVQLLPPPETLGLLQAIPGLAPGEVLDVKGELRLPLNAVRPVQQNGASFMVPLVRLALVGDGNPSLPHLELGCVFTVGTPGRGAALAPLRLDTGPRDFTALAAREIEDARRTTLFALDPARAAG